MWVTQEFMNTFCYLKKELAPSSKRRRLDLIRQTGSWRDRGGEESRIGQLYFYLMAVILGQMKKRLPLHRILGVFVEENRV